MLLLFEFGKRHSVLVGSDATPVTSMLYAVKEFKQPAGYHLSSSFAYTKFFPIAGPGVGRASSREPVPAVHEFFFTLLRRLPKIDK